MSCSTEIKYYVLNNRVRLDQIGQDIEQNWYNLSDPSESYKPRSKNILKAVNTAELRVSRENHKHKDFDDLYGEDCAGGTQSGNYNEEVDNWEDALKNAADIANYVYPPSDQEGVSVCSGGRTVHRIIYNGTYTIGSTTCFLQ